MALQETSEAETGMICKVVLLFLESVLLQFILNKMQMMYYFFKEHLKIIINSASNKVG